MNSENIKVMRKPSIFRLIRRTPLYLWVFRVVLVFMGLMFLYPLIFAFQTSFKTMKEFYLDMWAMPQQLLFENYATAWVQGRIGEYFLNSVIISVGTIVLIETFAIMASYALSRLHIPYVEGIILFFFVIQMLPTETIISPMYLLMSRTGIMKIPYLPIIIGYVGWSLPGTITIMKNYFDTVPKELLDACRIDGAGEVTAMFKIVLPLMKGAVATCSIMNFTAAWGELMWARTATMTTNKGIPLTVGLLNFQGAYGTDWPLLCAAIIVIAVPLYLMFLFLQKYFVASLTAGSVKG
ncbi:carbohydrate ABC transporter permease [Lachnospiraceae bacterium 54-11]